jgi:hypothetical protein
MGMFAVILPFTDVPVEHRRRDLSGFEAQLRRACQMVGLSPIVHLRRTFYFQIDVCVKHNQSVFGSSLCRIAGCRDCISHSICQQRYVDRVEANIPLFDVTMSNRNESCTAHF